MLYFSSDVLTTGCYALQNWKENQNERMADLKK
jgi:hypothetical protein